MLLVITRSLIIVYICSIRNLKSILLILKRNILFVAIVSFLFIGCQKKKIVEIDKAQPVEINKESILENKSVYVFSEKLSKDAQDGIVKWDEYFSLSEFLNENFSEISVMESLEISKELAEIVLSMKDSMQVPVLNTRGMFARLNTLNSEVLRLKDMSTISSIKTEEVKLQNEKIVSVFNSINSKINAVYFQKSLNDDVDFDESIFSFDKEEEKPYYKPRKKRNIPKKNKGKFVPELE